MVRWVQAAAGAAIALCVPSFALSVVVRSAQAPPAGASSTGAPVDFVRDIQPILEQRCIECHGATRARGSLRLDVRASVFRGGMTGPSVIPGDSEHSVLLRRILGLDGEDRMPLDEDPLPDAQVALIKRWIDEGAPWPEAPSEAAAGSGPTEAVHWAYNRPRRPDVPIVRDAGWPRTDIDRFILARLEREGLQPSPEASHEALIRRVSLDLTGLPPTLEEVDAFLTDTRPDAYERLVDALLASPHYGERWARPWLDLARYGDSHGYEKDRLRTMWRYRDWVIDALNADMPFDKFTIEQIAGDMLPDATDAQRVATGFHRNTLLNQEGGIDVEEARWETLVDRVNTTGTVWLGSTIACAQCHNHKYDPISQRDYYRMLAFFDNVEYTVGGQTGGDRWIHEPQLDLPTPEQAARRAELQAELDAVRKQVNDDSPAARAAQEEWERSVVGAEIRWNTLPPLRASAANGTLLTINGDDSVTASGPAPIEEQYTVVVQLPGRPVTGIRLEALPDPSLPQGGPGRDYYGNFVLTGFTVEAPTAGGPVTFGNAAADDNIWGNHVTQLLKPYESVQQGRDLPPGWAIDATRDEQRLRRQAVFVPAEPLKTNPGARLVVRLSFRGTAASQAVGRFRISVTTDPEPLFIVSVPAKARAAVDVTAASRTDAQRAAVASQFRATASALAPLRQRIAELERAIAELGIVSALVMKERPSHERPWTYFRERGSFLSPGEKVYAGTPAILPSMPDDVMPNRLGLARWLVHPDNPLTGRVTVNRAWEQFFGIGLVETSEDFGTQAADPSHPELLDWLATELVRLGWSQKALHRLIVTSATYRQSAAVSPALLERDPANRLLARGPRFRMEAEMIRDKALAAGGLLSRKVGGPSVFPPQPEGIWDNPYSDEKWVTSTGEDRYRRALYTFIRRTSPYPSLVTFDATSREFCTVRRVRTNTPLQALVTMNDEAFFEAARALAGRMLSEVAVSVQTALVVSDVGGATDEAAVLRARAAHGLRLVTSRKPTDAEVDRIVQAFTAQLDEFRRSPENARLVAGDAGGPGDAAERAAWTMVANALLNLDEAVTK
jgi:hypothetical protein